MSRKAAIHHRAAMVHAQIAAAWEKVRGQVSEEEFFGPKNPYYALLDRLYREDFPLAQIMDTADLVLHAEGPSAQDAKPTLHAINWMVGNAEKQLRTFSRSLFELALRDAKRLGRAMDLRLTGFAPGSIYAGVSLEPPEADLHGPGEEEPVFRVLREAIRKLPLIPTFVEDETISSGIYDAFPDPAQRDAGLLAAYHLAPTGKLGIHTLELFVPGDPPAELSQRERVVLREALKRPVLRTSRHGSFVGEVREIDLDKTRFHLRDVSGFGALRCILPEVTAEKARPLLGSRVRVEGEYDVDPSSGRPRLLVVSSITPLADPVQESIPEI